MGELAALATAVLWTLTSIFFTIGGREVGSVVVNRVRLALAIVFLMFTHLILQGTLFPVLVEPERWFWLGLSGIIGLVVGDAFLFQAFVLVGPRLSMLMMSLVPVISTVIAWVFLGERLSWLEIGAVSLTVSGIAWVVLERDNNPIEVDRRQYILGILAGLAGAVGQALGLVAAKKGLAGDFSVLSGVLIRMVIAAVVMWGLAAVQGQIRPTLSALRRNPYALKMIVAGSVVGPFLGVWVSLIAVNLARVGIAATLMALTPILILPAAHWVFKEKISARAIFGTVVALAGVTLIFMFS